jgi:exopolysaccharide biosynthesis polyprenyl glycosylphosphotransferase
VITVGPAAAESTPTIVNPPRVITQGVPTGDAGPPPSVITASVSAPNGEPPDVISPTPARPATMTVVGADSGQLAPGATSGHEVASDQREAAGQPPARRTWNQRYVRRLFFTDVLALIWAGVGVHLIAIPSIPTAISSAPAHVPYVAATTALLAAWFVAVTWTGSRDVKVVGHGPVEYKRIVQASFGLFGLVAISSYLLQLDLPRSYLLIMLPAGLAALLCSRYVWRCWLHRMRDKGEYMSHVLAVGDRHTVQELVRDLKRAPRAGYAVVGVCLATDTLRGETETPTGLVDGVPVLGGVDDVAGVARSCAADTVAVTSSAAFGPSRVRQLSWELEDTSAELILAPALTNIAGPRVHTQPVAGLPLIHVDRPTYRGANRILKKSFDVVGSGLLLLLFSPVLIGFAIAIKIGSKGPVFFRQDRVGINGDIFRMIKFRSMVVDAEHRLSKLRDAERDAGNVVLFKLKNDPRVTPVGKFIRRYSIDELPQLFNVLLGHMSLVGPRPPLKAEVDLYEDEARRRLLVKPGMTGLWQVSGRSDLTWDDSVRLDIYYVENWSITGDMDIICKTAKAVLSSSGAY